mmetsp:Transcript_118150/g.294686  ORF Transcript_118150/g.294686 Transcript_118150/m.294686 type:complete len:318 (-) Transcript_118150:342-1295(-)
MKSGGGKLVGERRLQQVHERDAGQNHLLVGLCSRERARECLSWQLPHCIFQQVPDATRRENCFGFLLKLELLHGIRLRILPIFLFGLLCVRVHVIEVRLITSHNVTHLSHAEGLLLVHPLQIRSHCFAGIIELVQLLVDVLEFGADHVCKLAVVGIIHFESKHTHGAHDKARDSLDGRAHLGCQVVDVQQELSNIFFVNLAPAADLGQQVHRVAGCVELANNMLSVTLGVTGDTMVNALLSFSGFSFAVLISVRAVLIRVRAIRWPTVRSVLIRVRAVLIRVHAVLLRVRVPLVDGSMLASLHASGLGFELIGWLLT